MQLIKSNKKHIKKDQSSHKSITKTQLFCRIRIAKKGKIFLFEPIFLDQNNQKKRNFINISCSIKIASSLLSLEKLNYYQQQIDYQHKKIAILYEIEFINNIQQLNNKYIKTRLQNYQKELGIKNNKSDFIELQDQKGNSYWQNLKTLKKYNVNPLDQVIYNNFTKVEEQIFIQKKRKSSQLIFFNIQSRKNSIYKIAGVIKMKSINIRRLI
ncbi:unnamed protein product [Paramecium sonneborni]|uniref:Uncharacterized protein n=1 Tax=Paramecium sonneborni TaxID=65129 RepID=A0A8S1LPR0_9CILI|nr:unnamed protein product [Paramecium sonneborni]